MRQLFRFGFGALVAACALATCWTDGARAATVTLSPAKDNTLYQDAKGFYSNGIGQYIFAGRTAQPVEFALRRAVLEFDVAGPGGIPAGSTITAVALTLRLNKSISGDTVVSLHSVQTEWGEGASDAAGEEGSGAVAERGDATWLHSFWDSDFWGTVGGDFTPAPSAQATVGAVLGPYTWSGAGMVADVQSWLDNPSSNHGWIVVGAEGVSGTAKRFGSRENPLPAERPVLMVTYTPQASGAGRVPEKSVQGIPLTLAKSGASLSLAWGASCLASDTDYEVYEGAIGGSFTSHAPVTCSTGGATTALVAPAAGGTYYLVVPRNASSEGSYGTRTPSVQRPASALACVPQSLAPCP